MDNKWYSGIKFEYVLILVLVAVIAYFVNQNAILTESAKLGLQALISALSGATGFAFGIRQVNLTNND